MSSFVVSLVIPVLIAAAFRATPMRDTLQWSWIAVLPDLDYATWNLIPGIPNLHRALLHNVVILGGLIGGTAWAFRRWRSALGGGDLWGFLHTRPGAGWALSSFYYASHLTLDMFAGGIALFFPFSRFSASVNFGIVVDTATNRPTAYASATTANTVPTVSALYPWLSNEETAIVVLVVVSALLWWWLRRGGPAAVRPTQRTGPRHLDNIL